SDAGHSVLFGQWRIGCQLATTISTVPKTPSRRNHRDSAIFSIFPLWHIGCQLATNVPLTG
ncbi:hypothetical protein, partial [Bifidobacterium jacchi]|uniref:hypothetical protein n=1 Tax=Bifidobacterium jacchi TaxID=2490545 RepID=UPI0019D57D57